MAFNWIIGSSYEALASFTNKTNLQNMNGDSKLVKKPGGIASNGSTPWLGVEQEVEAGVASLIWRAKARIERLTRVKSFDSKENSEWLAQYRSNAEQQVVASEPHLLQWRLRRHILKFETYIGKARIVGRRVQQHI